MNLAFSMGYVNPTIPGTNLPKFNTGKFWGGFGVMEEIRTELGSEPRRLFDLQRRTPNQINLIHLEY